MTTPFPKKMMPPPHLMHGYLFIWIFFLSFILYLNWKRRGALPGGTRMMVLYTCTTREMRRKGCFMRSRKRDSRESWLGVKMCLFLRRRLLLDSINMIKGHLGVLFQTPPKNSPQKACLAAHLGKIARNSCFVFPGEGTHDKGIVWKPPVMHVYNTSIQVSPPPMRFKIFDLSLSTEEPWNK